MGDHGTAVPAVIEGERVEAVAVGGATGEVVVVVARVAAVTAAGGLEAVVGSGAAEEGRALVAGAEGAVVFAAEVLTVLGGAVVPDEGVDVVCLTALGEVPPHAAARNEKTDTARNDHLRSTLPVRDGAFLVRRRRVIVCASPQATSHFGGDTMELSLSLPSSRARPFPLHTSLRAHQPLTPFLPPRTARARPGDASEPAHQRANPPASSLPTAASSRRARVAITHPWSSSLIAQRHAPDAPCASMGKHPHEPALAR
ncbi:MAG TPA: hypothetical protein VME20_09500 [Acidimicrobiales bacterium]|nr:hypothetical protein [Acidimicrobiales bacterium]